MDWLLACLIGFALLAPSLGRINICLDSSRALCVVPLVLALWSLAVLLDWSPFENQLFPLIGEIGPAMWRLDGLSLLMILGVLGVATTVLHFCPFYFENRLESGRFARLLLFLAAAMCGIALADNLLLLLVFWEFAGWVTATMARFHDQPRHRKKAQAIRAVNLVSTVILALGIALTYVATETLSISRLQDDPALLNSHPFGLAAMICLMTAALIRGAQFPAHNWMTHTVVAPTPASASAGMIKSGIYLLLVLHPIFAGQPVWSATLVSIGVMSMIIGVWQGIRSTHIKLILCYTTISSMGLMVTLTGIGSHLAIKSAMLFLFGQVLSKAALFLSAGIIYRRAHTYDLRQLGGLYIAMPMVAVAVGIATLSKAGFPPFFGSIKKDLIYQTGLINNEIGVVLLVAAMLVNMFLMALTLSVGIHPYWDRRVINQPPQSGPSVALASIGIWVLGIIGFAFGLYPQELVVPLVKPALFITIGAELEFSLSAWKGLSANLVFSALTIFFGLALYRNRHELWAQEKSTRITRPDH